MSAPKRIQLRRTKGWRKPEGAVVVARPSKWGNWYKVTRRGVNWFVGFDSDLDIGRWSTRDAAVSAAVAWFRRDLEKTEAHDAHVFAEYLRPLRGRDLACWCPLDQPCHADVLLDLANRGESA